MSSQKPFTSLASAARLAYLLLLGGLVPCLIALGLVSIGIGLAFLADVAPAVLVLGLPCLLVGAGWVLRLFQVFPNPRGRTLSRSETPELIAHLEEIQRGFRGPRTRQVLLARSYDLSLHMRPVFGVMGWMTPAWILGAFPLMYLGEREFTAAVGWDMAYWSDQHGWANLQVKRLLDFWHRISLVTAPVVEPAAARRRGAMTPTRWQRVLRRCDVSLGIYSRWFIRRATPFLHEQIAIADHAVAGAFGAQTFGRALLKLGIAEPMLEDQIFQPWLRASDAGGSFPEFPIQAAQDFFHRQPSARTQDHLRAALKGLVATAPPFLDPRLQALGIEASVPLAPGKSAFELFLPPSVVEVLESEWRADLCAIMQQRTANRCDDDQRYGRLRAADEQGELTPERMLELATLAESREPDTEFAARLDRLVERMPRNGNAQLLYATFHLERGDAGRGLATLDVLAALSPMNEAQVHQLLASHLERVGDEEGAIRARNAAIDRQPFILAAQAERMTFSLRDPMLPHGLSASALTELVDCLREIPGIRRVFLVRKAVEHFPESPVYLLGVVPRGTLCRSERARRELQTRLMEAVQWPAGAKGFVLVFGGKVGHPIRPLIRIKESEVFRPGRRFLPAALRKQLPDLSAYSPARTYTALTLLMAILLALAWVSGASRQASSGTPSSVPGWGVLKEEPATTAGLPLEAALDMCDFAHDLRAHDHFRSIVRGRLARGQFADLDRCSEAALRSRSRIPGGEWTYFALLEALGEPHDGEDAPDATWKAHLARLQEWLRMNPASETARVACAATELNYAWKARNNGKFLDLLLWTFDRRIREARRILEASPVQPPRSPMWYRIMQQVAAAQGWEPSSYNPLFERAVALEPTFSDVYAGKARYLHWIQGGQAGAWESFASEAADHLGGDDGDELYFFIVLDQSYDTRLRDLFANPHVSWPRMKRGFASIDRRYGTNVWFLNDYAFMASFACDREETRKVLERIGPRWDADVWGVKTDEAAMRRWANGQ